jgi:predicted amidohydrolase YtcJ
MTNTNASPVDSAKEIARRMIARHDRKHAAALNDAALRIAGLESSLAIAQTALGEQSSELRDAAEAVELLQARVTELVRERDAARADARYEQKCFTEMLAALRASSDYDHVAAELRRMQ